MAAPPFPLKEKKIKKKFGHFCLSGEGGFLVVNVAVTLIFPKLLNDPLAHYANSYPIYIQ